MDEKRRGNCPLTPGINCDTEPRVCSRCGWNPKVTKRRLAKIKEARELALHNED